jgi:hypothetical protein
MVTVGMMMMMITAAMVTMMITAAMMTMTDSSRHPLTSILFCKSDHTSNDRWLKRWRDG